MTPADEIEWRIQKLQRGMQQAHIDGFFILQRVDLFYFSGTAQNGFLFIPLEGAPLLLVKKYLPRVMAESPLKNIIPIRSVKDIPAHIADHCGKAGHRIAFEWDVMPVRQFHFFRRLFADAECVDGSRLIHKARSIKSKWEIHQIKRAARKSALLFEYIQKNIKIGQSHLELAARVEDFARSLGHAGRFRIRDYQKEGFTAQVLLQSGTGAMRPPFHSEVSQGGVLLVKADGQIEHGRAAVMEIRFVLEGYHLSESRTFAVGPLEEKDEAVFHRVLNLHNALLNGLRPGLEIGEWVRKAEKEKGSMLSAPSISGHGIGLELMEPPVIGPGNREVFEKGMVLAVSAETGKQSPIRAGMKSIALVTEKGHKMLSRVPTRLFSSR